MKMIPLDEIARLPRWAQVAFAARCARRVLVLYERVKMSTGPRRFIEIAEFAAAQGRAADTTDTTDAAVAADFLSAAGGAAAAAVAAFDVASADEAAFADEAAPVNAARPYIAALAADAAAPGDNAAIAHAMREDLRSLLHSSMAEDWTDETPVPPEFFAPLWPDGAPEWAQDDQSPLVESPNSDPRVISVYVDPGGASPADVAALYAALDALYETYGGSGLRVIRDEIRDLVVVPEGGE